MSKPDAHLPADSELQAPQGLADDLSALFGPAAGIPPETDQAILAMARQHLSRPPRPRRLLPWAAVAAAAAAVLSPRLDGVPLPARDPAERSQGRGKGGSCARTEFPGFTSLVPRPPSRS